jgi:DNA-binding NarL/FixJ family response regulator
MGRAFEKLDFKKTGALDGASVLIVEDEFIIAADIQAQLENEGAEIVGPCHTLTEALNSARLAQITAAVLDLRLGRDSTDPIAQILDERGVPFLFYSGQSNSVAIKAIWPDAALISKPASAGALVIAVRAMIDIRQN